MMRRMLLRGVVLACVLLPACWMVPGALSAEEHAGRHGFVFGAWAGYGRLNYSAAPIVDDSSNSFSLGFRGGYALTSNLVAGLELNGWLIEAGDLYDPAKGAAVSDHSIYLNYFPFKAFPIYFAGGGGLVTYWNNRPQFPGHDRGGWSWFAGVGYEIPASRKWLLVPQFRYSQGTYTGGDYDVFEVALGFHWYSGN